jgi:uncharacterized membrane-anchored protein
MSYQESRASETVIPFPNVGDPLDKAGEAACQLVHQAADVAEQKVQHLLGLAHKLSLQLRATEDRVADLQSEVKHYRERADRAEKWLHRIALEIEQSFFSKNQRSQEPASLAELQSYAPKRKQNS